MTTLSVSDPKDLPALYRSANDESGAAQRSFLRWLRVRILALIVAAAGGAYTWQVDNQKLGGIIAFVSFGIAIGAELYLALQRPDRVWYEGRAAAESAKTLAWRYMVRGRSFESDVADVDVRFRHQLAEILHDLDALKPAAGTGQDQQLSEKMREVRAASFEERREVYLRYRIQDQIGWYAKNSKTNSRHAALWVAAGVILELLGLLGGALKAFADLDIDALGVLASAAAGAATWLQAKQHQNLATAYAVTSQELAAVASEINNVVDESTWPQVVADAEEAISREHTLWRASRGVYVRSRLA